VQDSIDKGFEAFGTPLIDALKPVLDDLSGYFTGPGKAAVAGWGASLAGLIKDAMQGIEHGNWAPLQKDGETAFAAILKAASKGIDNLGIVLQAACSGPGMGKAIENLTKMLIAAAEAFGEAMMQSASSPLRKLEQLDVMVNPIAKFAVAARNKGDVDKFTPEQKQEFTDEGGGKDVSKDSEIIARIKGFSGVVEKITEASKDASGAISGFADVAKQAANTMAARDGSNAGDDGKPAGMDQSTWDTYYKPMSGGKTEPKTATAEPAGATTAAATTTTTPLATAAAATDSGTAQTASSGGFSPFQVTTPAPEKREAARSAPQRAVAAAKETSQQGPLTVAQQVMQQHWQTMKDLGMQPIGDSINPLDRPDESGAGATGFKGVMDATGVEHSLSGAVGPGGMPSWTPPPAMQPRDGSGSISTAVPAPAGTQGTITAAPAASAPAAAPAATMASGLAPVLAKLECVDQCDQIGIWVFGKGVDLEAVGMREAFDGAFLVSGGDWS
jgi:hypothetical protein